MAHKPQVSIIVPSYNKPEYLAECLESIRAQTFTDWECIVVSDGSPRVEEIRAAVAAMGDERFRLVEHKENRGAAAARNTGARVARGEWVICVDEDDLIPAGCLRTLLSSGISTGADIIHPQVLCTDGSRRNRHYNAIGREETLISQPLLGVGFLVRKRLWDRLDGYDESPLVNGREDHEWWIRVMASGVRVAFLEDSLYVYRTPADVRERTASLNYQSMLREIQIRRYIVRKHADLYQQFPAARREYLRRAYLREAQALATSARPLEGLWRYWGAFFVSWTEQDLRAALRRTMELVLGKSWTEVLMNWRRRWVTGKD